MNYDDHAEGEAGARETRVPERPYPHTEHRTTARPARVGNGWSG